MVFAYNPYTKKWVELDDHIPFAIHGQNLERELAAHLNRPRPNVQEIRGSGMIEIRPGGSTTVLSRNIGTFSHSVDHGTRRFIDLPREDISWYYWDVFCVMKINTSYVLVQTILPELSVGLDSRARWVSRPIYYRSRNDLDFIAYADGYRANLENVLAPHDYVTLWHRVQ